MKKMRNKKHSFWYRKKRVSLLLGLSVVLIASGYFIYLPYIPPLKEGRPSSENIYAERDLSIQTGIDEVKTSQMREDEAKKVRDVYDLNDEVQLQALTDLKASFDKVVELKQSPGLNEVDRLSILKGELKADISDWNLKALLDSQDPSLLENTGVSIAEGIFSYPIVSDSTMNGWLENGVKTVLVRELSTMTENEKKIENTLSLEQAFSKVEEDVSKKLEANRRLKGALTALIRMYLIPDLSLNREETSLRRETAKSRVPPVFKYLEIKKNMKIVDKGQPVTSEQILILRELSRLRGQKEGIWSILGLSLVTIVSLALLCIYLKLYEPKIYNNNRLLYLLSVLVLMAVFSAEAIGRFTDYALLIPIPALAMLISILISPRLSFVLTAVLSLFAGIVTGGRFEIALVSLLGGLVAIYSVLHVRIRFHILRAGALTGMVNLFCILSLGWINHTGSGLLWKEAGLGLVNGIASSFIVMGLLPAFESIFEITTDIRLLELADVNRPALKELILKAPGTYHHSLIVGNLAESACESIGANSMLARVGSYYHDLGKVEKAEYFVENQTKGESPHDSLTPTMSRLIILNHTKQGVEFAEKYKLDRILINFIAEHHGTSLMHFFYQRALEEIGEGVSEIIFRYTGPKPQTRESAIVLLADSVEAASRTLTNPTHAKLVEMVHEVINDKFIDGQLDECDLTLKDLHLIDEGFIRILQGRFHTRTSASKGEGEVRNGKAKGHNKEPEYESQSQPGKIEAIYKKNSSI